MGRGRSPLVRLYGRSPGGSLVGALRFTRLYGRSPGGSLVGALRFTRLYGRFVSLACMGVIARGLSPHSDFFRDYYLDEKAGPLTQ